MFKYEVNAIGNCTAKTAKVVSMEAKLKMKPEQMEAEVLGVVNDGIGAFRALAATCRDSLFETDIEGSVKLHMFAKLGSEGIQLELLRDRELSGYSDDKTGYCTAMALAIYGKHSVRLELMGHFDLMSKVMKSSKMSVAAVLALADSTEEVIGKFASDHRLLELPAGENGTVGSVLERVKEARKTNSKGHYSKVAMMAKGNALANKYAGILRLENRGSEDAM